MMIWRVMDDEMKEFIYSVPGDRLEEGKQAGRPAAV